MITIVDGVKCGSAIQLLYRIARYSLAITAAQKIGSDQNRNMTKLIE